MRCTVPGIDSKLSASPLPKLLASLIEIAALLKLGGNISSDR